MKQAFYSDIFIMNLCQTLLKSYDDLKVTSAEKLFCSEVVLDVSLKNLFI